MDLEQRWKLLPARTASCSIQSESPNIAQLRNMLAKHGDVLVQSILIHALNELKSLINVSKNLTNGQIAFLAQRIQESYWMLKVEEVKYVLYRAVEREKFYDRLDPNIVLGWFADYDRERTEEAMRLSDQESSQLQHEIKVHEDAVSWDSYIDRLWNLAMYADPEAVEKLVLIESVYTSNSTLKDSLNNSRRSEAEFKKYYYNHYLRNKCQTERS